MSAASNCMFQKPDGTTCKATSTPSGYCWFHDPNREQERAEARRKGGKSRSQQATVLPLLGIADVPLATVADVVKALATTFNDVRKGQVDPKTGNCLALISGQLLRAMQEGELAAELEALREELETIKHERGNAAAANTETPPADSDAEGGANPACGANPSGSGTGDDPGRDEAGPVAGEAAEGELDESLAPLFPAEREEPNGRSVGAG